MRVAVAAVVLCLAACVLAADSAPDSLAFKQEEPVQAEAAPTDMTQEDVFMSSFVEIKGDRMRKESRVMATKFVEDLRVALKKLYPGKGALSNAARSSAVGFDKNFREQCRAVSPSPKMCRNFVTIYRLQFAGANPFAVANGSRKRFTDAVRNIVLRWVAAWRQQHPKKSRKAGGNPWSAALRRDADVDALRGTTLSTRVRAGLNRFGRLNTPVSAAEKYLGVAPKGTYPLGTATDDPHSKDDPYKAHAHVKALREQLKDDLSYLRDKVYEKISDKKFHRMIGNPQRASKAILRTARICRREKKNHFFPPTFCRSVEYLASTNFVGRNFLRSKADFSALLASFMDHNHKQTTRYGYRVVRKPNYRQDVTAITAKFALKLRANRFNLRTFSRELAGMISNVMAVPRHRIRIASVRFGGYNRDGRRHTKVTFEFLPKKGDRRIRSRPHAVGSVDALAEQFRAMALNRPGSDFYKVPLLSRLLPKSIVMSKTLGRRPKSMRRYNLQSAAKAPRFAEQQQTLAAEVDVSADEEVEEGQTEHDDAEAMELEQADEEFTDSDAAVDEADVEAEAAADADAEADADAAEEEGDAQDEADEAAEMTDAERAELAAAEAAGEVALLEVNAAEAADAAADAAAEEAAELHGTDANAADVDEQVAALHLDADTATEEEADAEAEADELDDAAEADEAEENADADEEDSDAAEEEADAQEEAEEDADESGAAALLESAADAVAEVDALEAADEEDAEVDAEEDSDESEDADELDAEAAAADWHTAMMQQSEQLVVSDDSDDAADDEDSAEDEDEAESDDELDAEDEGAAERSAAANAAAITAPVESLPTLPEVNALPDVNADLQAAAAANDKAAVGNARAKAAVESVDAAEDAVFLEAHTKVTAQRDSSDASRAVPALAVAAALLLALAAQQ